MPIFTVGTYDHGADFEANLLAAINSEHGTNYSIAEYRFTPPERVTVPTPLYNTKIKLGPLAATGKIGFKTIYYNRIHASEIGPLTITWQNEQYLSELLPRLSEKYGIPLTNNDVYEQVIVGPVAPEVNVSITLNFKPTSIGYYGGDQIILGATDPAIEFETPQTLPFKNDLVFFVNNFIKTKAGTNYLESSTVSIASDRIRFRSMDVTSMGQTTYTSLVKNTYTDAEKAKLSQYLPFTFSWFVQDTKIVRGINIYGEVIEINETSNVVTLVSNLVNINTADKSELNLARTKISVREGTQAADGIIYFLAADSSASSVDFYRSTDFGESFSKLTLTKTNMATFNYANFDSVVIHDIHVHNNKISVLVTNPNTYGTHPIKRSSGPAVEEFNLDTGACDYFPIYPEFVNNTKVAIVYNAASKLRFVVPEKSTPILDVVAIARTSHTLEPVLMYCHRENGLEYDSQMLPTRYMDQPIYGVAAYSKPLEKDATGSFVAVELLTVVPTGQKDDYFLSETNIIGENSFMGYGVVTVSCIRKGEQNGGWSDSFVPIGVGSQPTFVAVTNKGQRRNYIFAGGNGIYTIEYQENAPGVFTPSRQTVFDTGAHSGFNIECDIGNGTYESPTVVENVQMAPVYNDLPDEESMKLPIACSFLVKSALGTPMWVTASDMVSPLLEREFGAEYRHLGDMPAAVFSSSTGKLFAWTKYQGIYVSDDQGNSWSDYAAIFAGYKNAKYLGEAKFDFTPEDFTAIQILGDITYAEVNQKRTINVLNMDTLVENEDLVLDDRVIYRVDGTKPTGDAVINSSFLTTSLNNTSDFSPRQVVGWDTDATNNIRVLTKYVESGTAKTLNQLDVPEAIKNDVLDVYSDVGFLDLKSISLTHNATDGFNLRTLRKDGTSKRHGLKGSVTPEFTDFEPTGIQPIWSGNDSVLSYTPIIILSKTAEVLVFEREASGYYALKYTTIVVPNDNAKPLKWFYMFSSNRHDRFVFQEGNGIYKLTYSWDGAALASTIGLVKMFDTALLNLKDVYSGCEYNVPNVTPYGEATIGPWPVRGTKLAEECRGFDLWFKYADGFGDGYWEVKERNNVATCNFVVVAPGGVGSGGGNINVGP